MFDKKIGKQEAERLANAYEYSVAQATLTEAFVKNLKGVADQFQYDRVRAMETAVNCLVQAIVRECKESNKPAKCNVVVMSGKDLMDLFTEGCEGNEVETD